MESKGDWNRNRRDFEPVDSWKAVKEESIEIKEEPIDDFAEVKQEELIADTPSYTEGNELSRNPDVKEEPVDDVKQADPSVYSSSSSHKILNGRGLANDEKLVKQLGLSVTVVEIAHMSTFEYEGLLYNRSLTKEQQEVLRKIRKRLQSRAIYHKISLPSSRFKYVKLATTSDQPEPEVENGEDSNDEMETDGEDKSMQPTLVKVRRKTLKRIKGHSDCGLATGEELAKAHNLPVTAAEIAKPSVANLKLCGLAADELLAKEHNLPITAAEIAEMSTADFSMLKEQYSLTEEQLQIIKKIRHREHCRAFRRKNGPFVSQNEKLMTTSENCKDEMQTDGEVKPSSSHLTSGKVYCHSTDVSRPIDQFAQFSDEEMEHEEPIVDVHIPSRGNARPLNQFKSSSRSKPKKRKGRPCLDKEIALANGLPFSVDEISQTPYFLFEEMLNSLTESQQEVMKQIRIRARARKRLDEYHARCKAASTPLGLDPTEMPSATAEQSKPESDSDEDSPRCELCGNSKSSPIQISLATIVELPDTFHLNAIEREDLCNRAMVDPTADVLLCREHFAYAHRKTVESPSRPDDTEEDEI